MKQIEVVIKDQTFKIRQSFRSYMLYEENLGKAIGDIVSIKDILNLLYYTLKGCNMSTFNFTFDEFIDIIDEQPDILAKFNEFNTGLLTDEKKNLTDQA